jgi:hypothetical protein
MTNACPSRLSKQQALLTALFTEGMLLGTINASDSWLADDATMLVAGGDLQAAQAKLLREIKAGECAALLRYSQARPSQQLKPLSSVEYVELQQLCQARMQQARALRHLPWQRCWSAC